MHYWVDAEQTWEKDSREKPERECAVRAEARGQPSWEQETETSSWYKIENTRKIEKAVGAAGVDPDPELPKLQIMRACYKYIFIC